MVLNIAERFNWTERFCRRLSISWPIAFLSHYKSGSWLKRIQIIHVVLDPWFVIYYHYFSKKRNQTKLSNIIRKDFMAKYIMYLRQKILALSQIHSPASYVVTWSSQERLCLFPYSIKQAQDGTVHQVYGGGFRSTLWKASLLIWYWGGSF